MTLDAGTKLGRYEIRSKIGEGGMGEVYLARDTQLGRDVAVKVLPSTYSQDTERLHRFEQEACAASALNHPNILSIYDVGTHDGSPYVVSELLEGQTLRQRTNGAQLSQRKVIDYALQISRGLAAAHEKGIVHRDLKPDNLFVTNDGRVKILDFGLAKLIGAGDAELSQTSIPTRRVDTDPGKVMGTVGYMSPEQVKGRTVDHRSDIFSFGAILYEMLSGRRAFHGESAAETMSAILKEDPPDLYETNQKISPALERLVNHCLEKNPEERFHSASDLAFALEALSGSTAISDQTAALKLLPAPMRWRQRLPWILTGLFALIAMLALIVPNFRRAPATAEQEALRFLIPLPEKGQTIGPPTISPNGRQMVYRLNTEDGKELLWLRPLSSLDARSLAGTEGAAQPFWSPDSRSIAFFAAGKLKRIDLSGGAPQTLCDAPPSNPSGSWGRDGTIIFSRGVAGGLYRVPAVGGTEVRITEVDGSSNELEHTWPYFLPDGRHFLYLARNAQPENSAIYVRSLDSKDAKRVLQVHSSVAFAPAGYLLFVRDTTLMAQAFDADKLEIKGDAVPLAEQAVRNPLNGRAMFSVSENGVIALRTGDLALNQLMWFDRTGKQLGTATARGNYNTPSLSPDEKRVAVSRVDFQTITAYDIWLIDLARSTQIRLTTDPASDTNPAWSSDGSRIAFVSTRGGMTSIYQKSSSGAGAEEALVTSKELKISPDWSPDGRFILYAQLNPKTNVDLFLLPLSGERKPEPFLQTNFIEAQGRFSPDGRWVAYISNETGQFEVYVQSFPAAGGKVLVSTGGGAQPQWRGDGKELYYYAPDRKLMAVEVSGEGSTFNVGFARPLFEIRVGGAGIDRGFPGLGYYTAARDGKRFLVAGSPEIPERQQITVVLNWTADLKK